MHICILYAFIFIFMHNCFMIKYPKEHMFFALIFTFYFSDAAVKYHLTIISVCQEPLI